VETQVAIVGGGPVGLGLAVDLGLRGVDVVLLERTTSVHEIPKGQNLTQRTMEHFRCWGVEEEIRDARLMPEGYPAVGVNAYASLASEYHHTWFRRSDVDRYYFARNERLPQYLTEQVLRDRLGDLAGVRARYGANVVDVEISDTSVSSITEDHCHVESEYLVGCDGSHSFVRESAGIPETLSDHDRKMVLLVFRSRELHEILEDRFGEAAFFNVLHPDLEGYWRFLGRVDVGESWFFHAPIAHDSDAATFDYRGLLHESVGASFAIDLDHVGFWDLRIAIADTYRNGRIFIAGDAAHSHPPYGGYGINTGLEDVRNLGWKLAATLQGWAGEALLDSYTAERRPVFASTARDFIEAFITNDREFVASHDPQRDRADFAAAWERRRTDSNFGVIQFEPHYEGSPIVFGLEGGETSAVGRHTLEPRPGHHLPPPSDVSVDLLSVLGSGFALIVGSSQSTIAGSFSTAAERLEMPLRVITHRDAPAVESYGKAILVRPDHFVSWVSNGSDVRASDVLRRATGSPDSPTVSYAGA
jgi:2-polyprenyl-6-methoxyphenol hydroxylase-like FAD-dependent oxidoreductase